MKIQRQKSGKRVRKGQRIALVLVMFVVGAAIGAGNAANQVEVEGLSYACSLSEECKAADAAAKAAKENARAAANTASYYQQQVNALGAQIANMELTIKETEAQIENLKKEIAEAEEKLDKEEGAIAEILLTQYLEGEEDPLVIALGSSDISEFAEKQVRTEVVKQQIVEAADKVNQLIEKLESDKKEVERLLVEQETAKDGLVQMRAEQQTLIAKYQHDAAAYEAESKAELEKQHDLEIKMMSEHPELFSGSTYSGDDTYAPWLMDNYGKKCPTSNWKYGGYTLTGTGWYSCECTSYVAWKVWERYRVTIPMWHDAKYWKGYAQRNGNYTVDRNPTEGAIGWTGNGEWGHVFWVESVSNGYVYITEYNNSEGTKNYMKSTLGYVAPDEYYGNTLYAYRWRFGSRKVSVGSAQSSFWFIHLK